MTQIQEYIHLGTCRLHTACKTSSSSLTEDHTQRTSSFVEFHRVLQDGNRKQKRAPTAGTLVGPGARCCVPFRFFLAAGLAGSKRHSFPRPSSTQAPRKRGCPERPTCPALQKPGVFLELKRRHSKVRKMPREPEACSEKDPTCREKTKTKKPKRAHDSKEQHRCGRDRAGESGPCSL